MNSFFPRQIQMRQFSGDLAANVAQEFRTAHIIFSFTNQYYQIAGIFEAAGYDMICSLAQPNHSDYRSGIDAFAVRLIIETDVATGHWSSKRIAGLSQSVNSLAEIPHYFRSFRRREVQAICHCQRFSSAANKIARGFRYNQLYSFSRIQLAI